MTNETEQLRQAYLEEVRWHLWFKGSKFSFFQGKASKELAAKHLKQAHFFFSEYVKSRKEGQ